MKLKLASLLAGGAMMLGSVVTVMSIHPPAQAKVPSGQIVLEDLNLSEKQQLSSLRESKPVTSQSKSVRNHRHGENGEAGNCPPGSNCGP